MAMTKAPYALFIDHIPGETRAALMQEDRLCQFHINRSGFGDTGPACEGDIYMGRVVNVVPSLQASFIDIGIGENGFLPVNATYDTDISKAVHEGQALLVQVKKAAQEGKGPGLSAKIELTGPHCILTPGRPGVNISRKFKDEAKRQAIKDVLDGLIPGDVGLVVRTSAETIDPGELNDQVSTLVSQWETIAQTSQTAPTLVHRPRSFFEDLWESCKDLNVDTICVEGVEAVQKMKALGPFTKAHTGGQSLFETEAIEDAIVELHQPILALDGGGNIHIERTSALIAIDVNTGERLGSRDNQDNMLRTNLAALKKIQEQIILRNLSGQIVIDFINLKSQSHRDKLADQVRNAFQKDGRTHVHGFTRMGLWELSRQRKGPALDEILRTPDAVLYPLVRKLSQSTGRVTLKLGRGLHTLWTASQHKMTVEWLDNRFGGALTVIEETQLSENDYRIEEG